MVEIYNSIVNSEFNTILPLQEAAALPALQSKDRILILALEYQIPGKITNNLLTKILASGIRYPVNKHNK
jgi:hypothetical protein